MGKLLGCHLICLTANELWLLAHPYEWQFKRVERDLVLYPPLFLSSCCVLVTPAISPGGSVSTKQEVMYCLSGTVLQRRGSDRQEFLFTPPFFEAKVPPFAHLRWCTQTSLLKQRVAQRRRGSSFSRYLATIFSQSFLTFILTLWW